MLVGVLILGGWLFAPRARPTVDPQDALYTRHEVVLDGKRRTISLPKEFKLEEEGAFSVDAHNYLISVHIVWSSGHEWKHWLKSAFLRVEDRWEQGALTIEVGNFESYANAGMRDVWEKQIHVLVQGEDLLCSIEAIDKAIGERWLARVVEGLKRSSY